MDTIRFEHRTSTGHQIVANLSWELRTLEDPKDGTTEDRWVLNIEATVDGMYANLWGPETYEGEEYVAFRTLHALDLYCVPKALWVEPPCPDPSYVRPSPPDISDLKGTYEYRQEMERRARMPRRI